MKDGHDNNKCNKCLNWDIIRAKYTKELLDSINWYITKPYQLTLELQYVKSKKIYQDSVDRKLSWAIATKQLKPLCYNGDIIKLIVNLVIIKHAINTDTLGILDLNRFHPLIDNSNTYGISYPDFAIYKRKKFSQVSAL